MPAAQHKRASQTPTPEVSPQKVASSSTELSLSTPAFAHSVLRLQQTIGNQAVQRLVRSYALQAKLKISQPSDIYEQEADRVAEEVMRMPEPALQRACGPCAAGGPSSPKFAAEEKELVQR